MLSLRSLCCPTATVLFLALYKSIKEGCGIAGGFGYIRLTYKLNCAILLVKTEKITNK